MTTEEKKPKEFIQEVNTENNEKEPSKKTIEKIVAQVKRDMGIIKEVPKGPFKDVNSIMKQLNKVDSEFVSVSSMHSNGQICQRKYNLDAMGSYSVLKEFALECDYEGTDNDNFVTHFNII